MDQKSIKKGCKMTCKKTSSKIHASKKRPCRSGGAGSLERIRNPKNPKEKGARVQKTTRHALALKRGGGYVYVVVI